MKWKTKTIVVVFIVFCIYYVVFVHKTWSEAKIEGTIKHTHPIKVWEFIADYSNMKLLNTLIEDFNIISESGNYDNWHYTVEYTEHLRYIPFIRNFGRGDYSVKQEGEHYVINSNHVTCFFSMFCVKSTSEFRFEKHGDDTKCTETVQYQCPVLFNSLCSKEVEQQRRDIMKRLKISFSQ